jgi:pimeloyl-ACP methyl ester carboxylesterase
VRDDAVRDDAVRDDAVRDGAVPGGALAAIRGDEGHAEAEDEVEVVPAAVRVAYDRLSPDGPEHGDVVLAKLVRLWTNEPRIDSVDLAGISAPTLVMAADRDTIRPDHTLLIASSIPGAQLCIVPGTTHGLIDERPGLVSLIVREFLQSTP